MKLSIKHYLYIAAGLAIVAAIALSEGERARACCSLPLCCAPPVTPEIPLGLLPVFGALVIGGAVYWRKASKSKKKD